MASLRHQRLGLDAVAADDRDGNALRLLEDGREEVHGLDRVAAAAAGVQQRELEQQLRRRRDAEVAPGDARQQSKMLFERLKDLVRVQLQIVHDLPEDVPLDLGERQAQVLVGQQRVFAPAGVFERAIDDALGRLGQFVLRDVEVLHDNLQAYLCTGESKMEASRRAGLRTEPIPVNCLTPNEK